VVIWIGLVVSFLFRTGDELNQWWTARSGGQAIVMALLGVRIGGRQGSPRSTVVAAEGV
jgi:hypothetical protein